MVIKESFHQFLLILHKDWLLQKRKKCLTAVEITLPILFGLILVLIRSKVHSKFESSPTIEPAFEITTHFNYNTLKPPSSKKWILAYCPDSPKVNHIMKDISSTLNMTLVQGYGFKNEDDLEKNLTTHNDVFGAIVFLEDSFKGGVWAEKIKYKIRLRAEQYEGSNNAKFKPTFKSGWLTKYLMPLTTLNGPRQKNLIPGGLSPGYYKEGFLTIQQAVDTSIMKDITKGNVSKVKSLIKKFPFPPYFDDKFVFILQTQFPFILLLCFSVIAPTICSEVTYEKEHKLKEAMKLMGLRSWVNWTAWFIKYSIMMLITVTWLTLLFYIKIGGASIITYTNSFITFIFLFLYSLNIIMFCFFITTLFKKASTAAAAGSILFLITYFPHFFLFFRYDTLTNSVKMFLSFIINIAMCQGCRVLAKYEEIGVGVQWNNLFQGPNLTDHFSMSHVFCMQIINLFFYSFLTWYIDVVKPGEFGTPQPWFFPFSKHYWRRRCQMKPKYDEEFEVMLNEKIDYKDKHEFFQNLPATSKIGIKIRNLTKRFPNAPNAAVNNISLDIKEGDITALLGHNGAGKTTTMSILTGFIPPTSGSASINGLDIHFDMEGIRRNLGLCPQFNILFDKLSVREHLVFFAKLKRCPKDQLDKEVDEMIDNLGLRNKRNTASKALSGGMKRKLCVGIALIAGSKFVILDEPSSGMDPEARRQMWGILKRHKPGRTIILSTHYMDEADYLGDRIAIMADGKIHCCGSSMFLKNKYGVGYHMTLVKTADCDVTKLKALIQQYIPNAILENAAGAEISYILPKENSGQFPDLFNQFETNGKELGVASFGASVTTIEEVFIKVKVASEKEDALIEQENHLKLHPISLNNINESANTPFVDVKEDDRRKKGCSLRLQQIRAMLVKRMLNTWRNRLISGVQLCAPVIFCIISVLVVSSIPKRGNPPSLSLSVTAYKDPITYYATAHDYNDTSEKLHCMEDVIKDFKGTQYYLNHDTNLYYNDSHMDIYLLEQATKSFFHFRNRYQVAAEVGNDYLKGFYNDESYHTIAMSLSMVNNAWLKFLTKSNLKNYSIETINHPLPWYLNSKATIDRNVNTMIGFIFADLLMFGMAFLVATFIVFLISERVSGAKSSQYVSGASPSTFWFSTFVWDYFNYFIPACCVIIVLIVSKADGFTYDKNLGYIFCLLMLYAWGVFPTIYLLSFFFMKPSSGYVWTSVINYFGGTVATLVVLILRNPSFDLVHVSERLEWLFYTIFPNFCLEKGIQDVYVNFQNNKSCTEFNNIINLDVMCPLFKLFNKTVPCCLDYCGNFCMYSQKNYLAWEYPGIGRSVFFLTLQGFVYFSFLFLLESDLVNMIKGVFLSTFCNRKSSKKYQQLPNPSSNAQQGLSVVSNPKVVNFEVSEDDDVRNERNEAVVTPVKDMNDNEVILLIKDLMKIYSGHFRAVNNLCLKVKKGECFGLLGVNGAGKTSTFKMMTGDESISHGEVFINGVNVAKNRRKTQKFLGYCPQFDALIDQLTPEENLMMHGRLRGMYAEHIQAVSEILMKNLILYQYKDRQVARLSGGNKRKLGIAIALIGNPILVFLDEPSAGMDPVARRELWNCVTAVREAGKTVILTSHSMEECEALCTRMAIMVNGEFKCLGSCQHLKSKFGSGFSVVLKVSVDHLDNVKGLHAFMKTHYPGAYIEYESEELIGYRIEKHLPNASLAKIFKVIEEHKTSLNLEDYSVGQTSLEQVFINFAKAQKK